MRDTWHWPFGGTASVPCTHHIGTVLQSQHRIVVRQRLVYLTETLMADAAVVERKGAVWVQGQRGREIADPIGRMA